MLIPKEIENEILKIKPCYFPNAFPGIFSWGELENLLNLRPFVNGARFKIINDKPYTWNRQAWMSDANCFPPSLLEKELKQYHCYFIDASRVNKSVNSMSGELEKLFEGSAVDAHIYFTVSDNLDGGFGIHWDHSHNLIVQVEGSTRFLLWDHYANNSADDRFADVMNMDPLYDVVLNPGDAVFVPLRCYHKASSQTKRMSVSFPISIDANVPSQDRHWIKL